MNFKIFGRMQSNPAIKLETDISPLEFGMELRGALTGELGPFSAHIGEIPIKLKIPFLRRERVIASLGGIPLSLNRFRVDVENAVLEASGVVGMKGIHAVVESQVECTTDMQLNGKASGRIGLSSLDLDGDTPDENEEWEGR